LVSAFPIFSFVADAVIGESDAPDPSWVSVGDYLTLASLLIGLVLLVTPPWRSRRSERGR
jgi:hypothetical protein